MNNIYAAKLKDVEQLKKSSSGGMFFALAEKILSEGGSVIAACYDYENNKLEHILIREKNELSKALGSKYMQSDTKSIFEYLKILPNDRQHLFIGTGCQVAAAMSYARISKIDVSKVIFTDIICHGVPSPMIWSDFISELENQNGKIEYLTFKDKRRGWLHPYAYVKTEDGKEHSIDEYVKIFHGGCALRPSCYFCPYTSVERETDITIGDFWGIENKKPEFYDANGVSLVLVHTVKGKEFMSSISETIDMIESSEQECLQKNLMHPTEIPDYRDNFWDDYHNKGIRYVCTKYGRMSIFSKVKNKINKLFKKKDNYRWILPNYFCDKKEVLENITNYKICSKLVKHKENCCGCGNCGAVCPVDVIEMSYDKEGFLYPNVNIEKCINCGKCEKACSFKAEQIKKGYMS